MRKYLVIIFAFFFTSCISLTKDEANYSVSYKINIAKNNEAVFLELKNQIPVLLKKHNFSYEISSCDDSMESYFNKKYKNPSENMIDKIIIDEELYEISAFSFIYVRYSFVPIKTYFNLKVKINSTDVDISFNEINTYNFYINTIQLNKFKSQAQLFIDDLCKEQFDKGYLVR